MKDLNKEIRTYNYNGLSILHSINIQTIKKILLYGEINELTLLYNTMLIRDLHISSELQKRKMQIVAIPSLVACEDKKVKEFLEDWLNQIKINQFLLDIGSSIGYGFSIIDLIWNKWNGYFVPIQTNFLKHEHFYRDIDKNLLYLHSRDESMLYIEDELKFFTHFHKSESGTIEDFGILKKIIWHFIIKDFVLTNYLKYTEILGVPPLIIKTQRDTKELEEIATSALGLRDGGIGIFGSDDIVELIEGRGSNVSFNEFISYIDSKISQMILGSTLTSDTKGVGSYALGQIHNEVRLDYLKFDCYLIEESINSLIEKILKLNFPNAKAKFKFDMEERDDKEQKSKIYKNLFDIGYVVDREFVERELNVKIKEIDNMLKSDYDQKDNNKNRTAPVIALLDKAIYDLNKMDYPIELGNDGMGIVGNNKNKTAPVIALLDKAIYDLNKMDYPIELGNDGMGIVGNNGNRDEIDLAIEKLDLKPISNKFNENLKAILESSSDYDEAFSRLIEAYPEFDMSEIEELLYRVNFNSMLFGDITK